MLFEYKETIKNPLIMQIVTYNNNINKQKVSDMQVLFQMFDIQTYQVRTIYFWVKPLIRYTFYPQCFILYSFIILFFLSSCDGDFLEDPSTKGINTHSFKLGETQWVKSPDFLSTNYLGINYNYFNKQCLTGFFNSKIKGDEHYPSGIFNWVIFRPELISDLPKEYPLKGFTDYNELFLNMDSSFCHVNFTYDSSNVGGNVYFTEAVTGSMVILRYDSICSGTFNLDIACDDDTVYITVGKFDYEIRHIKSN